MVKTNLYSRQESTVGTQSDNHTGALSKAAMQATMPGHVLGLVHNARMVSFPLLLTSVPGWEKKDTLL